MPQSAVTTVVVRNQEIKLEHDGYAVTAEERNQCTVNVTNKPNSSCQYCQCHILFS